jgi:hypothetical protein
MDVSGMAARSTIVGPLQTANIGMQKLSEIESETGWSTSNFAAAVGESLESGSMNFENPEELSANSLLQY